MYEAFALLFTAHGVGRFQRSQIKLVFQTTERSSAVLEYGLTRLKITAFGMRFLATAELLLSRVILESPRMTMGEVP